MGSVSDSSARVLRADSNTRIYFQSNQDYSGTVQDAITFRAWDQTQGSAGTLLDASTNGGTTAFSSDSETADITVTAVNDAPVITSDGGNATAAINVNETISAVTTVTVSDVDEPAQTITYSLGGIDAGDFSIDTDGNLTFTSAPDFANPTDDDADNVYVVTVTASDGSLSDSQTITVTVVDVSPTSLVVTTTADTDDTGLGATYTIEQLNASGGGADGFISLREAITAANSTTGADTISFNISTSDAGFQDPDATIGNADDYWRIQTTSRLIITDAVHIDGTTQAGYAVDSPVIQLDGVDKSFEGFRLESHTGTRIEALNLVRFDTALNLFQGGSHTIVGNLIGLANDGITVAENDGVGIRLTQSTNVTIGGDTVAERNVLSGATEFNAHAISIGTGSTGAIVQGNYIGTDVTGTLARGNSGFGIVIAADNALIGTDSDGNNDAAEGNLIADNNTQISLFGDNVVIAGNTIEGNAAVSSGILVRSGSAGSVIGGTVAGSGNTIINNGAYGVSVLSDADAAILGNTITGNGFGVISLSNVNANDGAFVAEQGNDGMDSPTITVANLDGNALELDGFVGSAPNQTIFAGARVEFFREDDGTAEFIGFLTTDANGLFSGTLTVSGLSHTDNIVATATSDTNLTSETGNTQDINAAVVIANNTGTTVAEGSTGTVITTAMLSTTDADSNNPNLAYTITAVPANGKLRLSGTEIAANGTFTQDDIDTGKVTYDHDGSETTSDSFTFSVTDGDGSTKTGTFSTTVTPVNDAPVLTQNDFSITEGGVLTLTNSNLNATDAEGDSITFNITNVTGGGFYNGANGTLNSDRSFTMAQLQAGDVVFLHASSDNAPTFDISVTDGTDSTTAVAANVTFTEVNDQPYIDAGGLGDVSIINTTLSRNQVDPDSITLTGGDVIVAWSDGQDSYAQRFDSNGNAVDVEIQLDDTSGSFEVDLVATSTGGFVATWRDWSNLVVREFDALGAPLTGSSTMISFGDSISRTRPDITELSNGNFVLSYIGGSGIDSSGSTSAATLLDENFNVITSDIIVPNVQTGGQFDPKVTSLQGGGFAIAFTDAFARDGNGHGTYLQFFDNAGTSIGTNQLVNINTDGHQQVYEIATLADGNVLVSYRDVNDGGGFDVFGRLYSDSGTALGSPFALNQTTAGFQASVDVVALSDGSFAASWFTLDGTGEIQVFVRQFDASGNPLTDEIFVAASDEYSAIPTLTESGDGSVRISWQGDDGTGNGKDIYSRSISFAPHSVSFTENATGVVLHDSINLIDFDDSDLTGATLQITGNFSSAEDALNFSNQNNIAGIYDSVSGTLTLSGTDSIANYEAALRSITYVNGSDNPDPSTRSIEWTVTDGTDESYTTTTEVVVVAVNDAPVVTSPASPLSFTEQGSLAIQGTGFSVSDVDDNGGQLTAVFTVGEGRVLIDSTGSGVTVLTGNSTDTVTFSGTEAQINSLLDGTFGTITYLNDQTVASDTPSASTTITLTVNDQGNTGSDPGDSGDASSEEGSASQTINITSVNDAPTFLGPELVSNGDFGNSDLAGTGWTTTGAAVVQSGQLNFGGSNATTENTLSQTINTVDGETYTLSFNYRDRSGGTNTLNQSLVVSVDGIGNLLTTEAILTDTDDQIYVRYTFTFTADSATSTIKFTDTSADPDSMSSGSESNDGRLDNISVKQTDGNLSSVTYVEDSTPVVLDADLLLFDAEISAGLDDYSGTTLVLQRNGGQNSDDVFSATGNLVFDGSQVKFPISGTEQVIGTLTNSDGTLSIEFTNASLTESDINEILQSITYSNTNQAPPSSVQIDWTFNDSNEAAESDPQGTGSSLTATGSTTVNITAVNDAPVISGGPDSVGLTETNAGLTSTGELTVTDVDTTDNVTASVDSVVVTGTGSTGAPAALDNDALKAFLTVTPTAILNNTENSATLTWDFNSGSEAFNFLAKDETLILTYTVRATDDNGTPLSDTETVTVTITGTNDAPTLTDNTTVILAGTNEDTISAGSLVSSIFASAGGADVDAGSLSGIAITSVTGNNTWQYSTDGTNWTDFGSVSSTSALLLTSTTQVRYSPDGVDGETATFEFIGWDQTVSSGSTFGSPTLVDPTGSQGGTNEFSTESATASLVVTSVNDAVTAVADTGNATESGGVANATAGSDATGNVLSNDTDVDPGDTLNVTGVAAGTVASASANVASSVTGTYGNITIGADGNYTYVVDENNSVVQALLNNSITDTFTYTVTDSGGATSSTQIVVTINGQNDAPVAVADTTTAVEAGGEANADAGTNPTGNLLTNDTDVDAGDSRKPSLGVVVGTANRRGRKRRLGAGGILRFNHGPIRWFVRLQRRQ